MTKCAVGFAASIQFKYRREKNPEIKNFKYSSIVLTTFQSEGER